MSFVVTAGKGIRTMGVRTRQPVEVEIKGGKSSLWSPYSQAVYRDYEKMRGRATTSSSLPLETSPRSHGE